MSNETRTVESRLSSIETKLDHTNKTVDQIMPLMERVVRLEERQHVLDSLPTAVKKNEKDSAVNMAVENEKERAREEVRANIGTIVAIAGLIGSVVSFIGTYAVTALSGG